MLICVNKCGSTSGEDESVYGLIVQVSGVLTSHVACLLLLELQAGTEARVADKDTALQ